jgi:tetratricopeptide (TPR) repeat protein
MKCNVTEKRKRMGLLSSLRERLGRRNAGNRSVPGALKRRGELAYSFIRQGDCLAAREQVLKALEQRNEIGDVAVLNWLLELLAWTWTLTEQYRNETEFFSKYLKLYPTDVRAYTLRAGSLWYSGELRQAIDDYSTAVELDPNELLAHLGRGQVLAECGEYGRAIDDLDFVHESLEQNEAADPSWKTQVHAYSFNGRAVAHAGLGDFERAMAEFYRSISLCPENAWVYFNRAMVYEKKGQLAKAMSDYTLSLQKTMPKLSVLKRKYAEVKVKTIVL